MNKRIEFRNGPKAPARFWNMVAEDSIDEATITMYGDVVAERPIDWWTGAEKDGMFICPKDFLADLETIKNKATINIKINSNGGDVYTALAIHNALKALPGKKNVIVEGIAASAASVIAMAGDTVKMFAGSIMMIHGVSGFLCDWFNVADLKKVAKGFDACNKAIAAIYALKTGRDEDAIRGMMDRESWMTGAEAIEQGFADELIDGEGPDVQYNAKSHVLLVNGIRHNVDGLTIPERFNFKPMAEAAAVSVIDEPPQTNEGADVIMDVQELRAQYPELVAQIEAEAVAADRARIQEIEEIQDTIGDAELVAKAKFVSPTNAAALALEAMKKQAAMGADFLAKRRQEQAAAAAVQAAATQPADPTAVEADAKAKEAQAIEQMASLYNQIYK